VITRQLSLLEHAQGRSVVTEVCLRWLQGMPEVVTRYARGVLKYARRNLDVFGGHEVAEV
jgi:hypothetical protein